MIFDSTIRECEKAGGRVTEETKTVSEDYFTGVTRNRTARYYLSGIDPKSSRSGIISYLNKKNVHVTYLKLFNTGNTKRRISANINVSKNCESIVELDGFWPEGVFCRKWFSNNEWYQRFSNEADDVGQNSE